jgi:hypothetical protein
MPRASSIPRPIARINGSLPPSKLPDDKVVCVTATGAAVDAGATVGLGAGVGVAVGTAVGVIAGIGTSVGVAASTAAGGEMGVGVGDGGTGVGVALGLLALIVKVLDVAVTDPAVATSLTVPVRLPGTVWSVVEEPVPSVVTELRS